MKNQLPGSKKFDSDVKDVKVHSWDHLAADFRDVGQREFGLLVHHLHLLLVILCVRKIETRE